jgi:hypothetical protein
MFDQIFDSFRKATEVNVQMQQELFKRWAALWPGMPAPGVPPAGAEQAQAFPKKWAETINELVKRQQNTQQEMFAAGIRQMEEAFKLAEVKDVEALRAKTLELWQKSFQFMQHAYETQFRDFQTAVAKWSEMFTKAA